MFNLARRNPARDGLAVALILSIMALLNSVLAYDRFRGVLAAEMRSRLSTFAVGAASLVDPVLHEALLRPEQESTETYQLAVKPLRELLKALPQFRYIYTTRLVDGRVRFVLDSAPQGDQDRDGVEDHSFLMDLYDDPDPNLVEALKNGDIRISHQPYTDKWGTFISAYAPIRGASGKISGTLGVDVRAEDYVGRLNELRRGMAASLLVQVVFAVFFGFLIFLVRRWALRVRGREEEMEGHLRQSLERYEILARVSRDVTWDWDLKTDHIRWNEGLSSVFLYKDGLENSGAWWKERIYPEDSARVIGGITQVINGKEGYWTDEYRFRLGDGNYADVLDRGYVIRDAGGRGMRMIGSMIDVTQRRRTLEQQIQSQKMETMGTLAGGIAHDLNNQLTPLIGFLDLVKSDLDEKNPAHSLVTEAWNAARRSADIVHRLVAFAKPSKREKKCGSLDGLERELGALLRNALPSTIEVRARFGPGLWPVTCNESEIVSVIMSMATNARDAMKQGGLLEITADNVEPADVAAPRRFVRIRVADTGTGIPKETLPRIFEPFFSTKPKSEGTGLGLSMSFNIIKDHGGRIEVQTDAGKGTMFDIYLPAVDKENLPQAAKTAGGSGAQTGGTVLVAEDEEPIRRLASELLTRLGYRVLLAADGPECIELYRKHHQDVSAVLMDMTMPKLTGRQTLKQLLEIDPGAKVVVASGYTQEGSWDDILREGAKSYLTKPYTSQGLSEALKKATAL